MKLAKKFLRQVSFTNSRSKNKNKNNKKKIAEVQVRKDDPPLAMMMTTMTT